MLTGTDVTSTRRWRIADLTSGMGALVLGVGIGGILRIGVRKNQWLDSGNGSSGTRLGNGRQTSNRARRGHAASMGDCAVLGVLDRTRRTGRRDSCSLTT